MTSESIETEKGMHTYRTRENDVLDPSTRRYARGVVCWRHIPLVRVVAISIRVGSVRTTARKPHAREELLVRRRRRPRTLRTQHLLARPASRACVRVVQGLRSCAVRSVLILRVVVRDAHDDAARVGLDEARVRREERVREPVVPPIVRTAARRWRMRRVRVVLLDAHEEREGRRAEVRLVEGRWVVARRHERAEVVLAGDLQVAHEKDAVR